MTAETVQHVEQADDRAMATKTGSRVSRRWLMFGAAAVCRCSLVGGGYFWLGYAGPDAVWKAAEAALSEGRIDRAESRGPPAGLASQANPRAGSSRRSRPCKGGTDEALNDLAQIPDDHKLGAPSPIDDRADKVGGGIEPGWPSNPLLKPFVSIPAFPSQWELIYIFGYQLRREELADQFQALGEVSDLTFDNVFHWCLLRSALWDPGTAVDEFNLFIQADPKIAGPAPGLGRQLPQDDAA